MPTRCSTCGTSLAPGAARCPGCGRTIGEINRCPSCQAVAALKAVADGYVCSACNTPRVFQPGMTVTQGATLLPAVVPKMKSFAASGGALGLRIFALFSAVGGLTSAAFVAAFASTSAAIVFAGGLAGTGVGVAGLAAYAAHRVARSAMSLKRTGRELEILRLAERHGGELFATDVARRLGISTTEADTLLTSLVDGARVQPEVTPDGLVRYVFREIARRSQGPRVRVEDPASQAVEAELVDDEAERERAKGAR